MRERYLLRALLMGVYALSFCQSAIKRAGGACHLFISRHAAAALLSMLLRHAAAQHALMPTMLYVTSFDLRHGASRITPPSRYVAPDYAELECRILRDADDACRHTHTAWLGPREKTLTPASHSRILYAEDANIVATRYAAAAMPAPYDFIRCERDGASAMPHEGGKARL